MPGAESDYRNSAWLNKQQSRTRRSRWILIGCLLGVAAIAIAVAVGVTVSKAHSKPANRSASSTGSSSDSSSSGSANSPVKSDPNDPSIFTKDPRLHNSFYGLAYTPEGSILPNCGAAQADVITDIQLMSQLTNKIRLYGSDCNISALVLNAIKLTKVDMQVYLGNYIDVNDPAAYTRQKATIEDAIRTYGTDHITGVTVGNEVMLNYCVDHGLTDPNNAAAQPAADYITASIADTRSSLAAMGLTKNILVGNSDAGSYFSTFVLEAIDYGLSNVHPWFAHTTAQDGAAWTWDFFQENNVAPALATTRKPQMYIAETGWPTASNDTEHATSGAPAPGGSASVANLQVYLDTFVCQANQNGTGYFYFEFFDEKWKEDLFGGVEGYWGLFDKDKKLKDVTIPTCSHP